jgi:hypothetical protein
MLHWFVVQEKHQKKVIKDPKAQGVKQTWSIEARRDTHQAIPHFGSREL